MSTATANIMMDSSTDARFRAWGSGISAQLAAFGWIYVADAGRIDWGTVLKPAVGSTKQGFEVYRFADALQATSPVFVRIDYGSGSNAGDPSIWYTFGTATDGAGNVVPGNLDIIRGLMTQDANTRTAYFSGTTGRGVFCTGPAATAGVMVFSVERTKDAAGADTGDGLLIAHTIGNPTNATQWRQQYYQLGVGSQGIENRLGILMPSAGSGVTGADTAIYPLWHPKGPFLPYGLNLFGYFTDDLVALNTYVLTVYLAAHTYLALGPTLGGCVTGATASKSTLLMRYE